MPLPRCSKQTHRYQYPVSINVWPSTAHRCVHAHSAACRSLFETGRPNCFLRGGPITVFSSSGFIGFPFQEIAVFQVAQADAKRDLCLLFKINFLPAEESEMRGIKIGRE